MYYKHEIKTFSVPTHCLFGTINQYGEKYKTAILDAMFTGNDQQFSIGDLIYIVHADLSHVTTVHKDDIIRWICYHE